ncbi:unnamed protein product [Dracunculus medinensis]|uniref:Uncharacterized protein n=1 Tax=Dracunculus medinensis TaxID=318479 RepID=A0A3P7QL32_DRAME|nr:unnamed protein product [Dracunculus medinensis]
MLSLWIICQKVALSAYNCIKSEKYSSVFIRAYIPKNEGMVDSNYTQNIYNAHEAGLGTEIYAIPNVNGSKNAYKQVDEIYMSIQQDRISLNRMWLKVTSPIHWPNNQQANTLFIEEFVRRAAVSIENKYWNALGRGYESKTEANFNDFRPFASFTFPSLKTFALMTPICGIVADQIVYPMPVNNIRTSDRFLQKSEKILIGSVKFLPN